MLLADRFQFFVILTNPGNKCLQRPGFAVIKTLHTVTAHIFQYGELTQIFDTFGSHFQAQHITECQYRATDFFVTFTTGQVSNKTAVNFYPVKRKMFETAEG